MNVTRFESLETLSLAAADRFVATANAAIEARGRFTVALSGGNTPRRMHELLAEAPRREAVAWEHVQIFFGDERFVPLSDPRNNEHAAREALIGKVHPAETHGMVRKATAEASAAAYEALLHEVLGLELVLDLVLLGLGPDGHTASLFPGDDSVFETRRMVVAAKASAGVPERITMTPPLLTRARSVLFLISGEDKAPALERLLSGPENWEETPSQAVARHAEHVDLFVTA